jgi:hypothetical protein
MEVNEEGTQKCFEEEVYEEMDEKESESDSNHDSECENTDESFDEEEVLRFYVHQNCGDIDEEELESIFDSNGRKAGEAVIDADFLLITLGAGALYILLF